MLASMCHTASHPQSNSQYQTSVNTNEREMLNRDTYFLMYFSEYIYNQTCIYICFDLLNFLFAHHPPFSETMNRFLRRKTTFFSDRKKRFSFFDRERERRAIRKKFRNEFIDICLGGIYDRSGNAGCRWNF